MRIYIFSLKSYCNIWNLEGLIMSWFCKSSTALLLFCRFPSGLHLFSCNKRLHMCCCSNHWIWPSQSKSENMRTQQKLTHIHRVISAYTTHRTVCLSREKEWKDKKWVFIKTKQKGKYYINKHTPGWKWDQRKQEGIIDGTTKSKGQTEGITAPRQIRGMWNSWGK